MNKLFAIVGILGIFLIASNAAYSQEEKEEKSVKKEIKMTVKDDGDGPKYTVETITEENGEQKVEKKTYSSKEEMEADADIQVHEAGENVKTFTMKMGEEDPDSNVMIIKSDDSNTFNIKVDEMSEDFEWTSDGGKESHKVIKMPGGKMMFIQSGDDEDGNSFTFSSNDGDSNHMVKRYEVRVMSDGDDADIDIIEEKDVIILKDEDGNITMNHDMDGDDMMIWMDEGGNKTINKSVKIKKKSFKNFNEASIEDLNLNDEEFASFNLSGLPVLTLKSLNYYPNPNEGEFTLAFAGSKKPVIVRVLDNKGNMRLEKNIENFDGNFNEVINLKHLDKGSYLLQIFQQGKAISKKVVLK